MKEIKILIQQLRDYPNNFFVVPHQEYYWEVEGTERKIAYKYGLIVCDHLGKKQGFIETGGEEGVVTE